MKHFLRVIILFPLLMWISCEDDKLSNEDQDTLYRYELHSNNRVSSLLMTESEYDTWINEDGFSDPSIRVPLVQDVYERFEDKYDNGVVAICGGTVDEIKSQLPKSIQIFDNLVLDGLECYSQTMG